MVSATQIKDNGKVDLWCKSEDGEWVKVELWAIDANHALAVDPDNYAVDKPEPVVEPEPEFKDEE